MDVHKALKLNELLKNEIFTGYKIIDFINNGKSAAVFKGSSDTGENVAIKIFDNDLVERFGHEIQENRIQQEINLKGHTIPNLIKILNGGKTRILDNDYYFVVMEYLDGINLKEYIKNKKYDEKFIKKVCETLYKTSEELLKNGIVHRDIKPENVMILSNNEIVLLDLGVLKLVGVKSFTDQEEKQFVGTLRYSPPEYLMRVEEDTNEGWRAVNLYQIGAIMHDLIMKKELFDGFEPYSKLVLGIKEDVPRITSDNMNFKITQLARDMLMKDWRKRLEICSIIRLESYFTNEMDSENIAAKKMDEIFNYISAHKDNFTEIEEIKSTNEQKRILREKISVELVAIIDSIFDDFREVRLIDKFYKSNNFDFKMDGINPREFSQKNIIFRIDSDISRGFLKPIFIFLIIANNESCLTTIHVKSFLLSENIASDLENPKVMLYYIFEEKKTKTLIFNYLFSGVANMDEQFKEAIKYQLLLIIENILKEISPMVFQELERRKKYEKGEISEDRKITLGSTLLFPSDKVITQ